MAKLRYAFFPGCTLESAAGELKVSTEKTCKALGIELAEVPGWTCCGAAQIQDIDDFLGVAINARNIALAEKAHYLELPFALPASFALPFKLGAKPLALRLERRGKLRRTL